MLMDLIQNKAWAIHPAKLDEMNQFIEARLEDPTWSVEVAKGKTGNKADDRYQCVDGVAVIPVYGVIDKRANMFMEVSGGTSTELLKRDFRQAMDDPSVKAILLDVDSPGGSVDGTKDLADLVYASRGTKPIVAYANGMMASAAYWIGSAADMVVAGDTAMVGSIGVALTHYDRSVADERAGVKRTIIYAGKYKRIASDEKPLTEEGQEYLQSMVDTYYGLFVESVAANRGTDVETVLKKMADGKEFIGKKALKAGLVDQIGNLDNAIAHAVGKGRDMEEKMKAEYQSGFEAGAASVDIESVKAEARADGIATERARVLEIMNAGADQTATLQAITDGTSADAAYKSFYEAEKTKRAEGTKGLESLPESVGQAAVEKDKPADFMALAKAYQTDNKCGFGTAVSAIAKSHPDLHTAWLEGRN